MKGKVFFATALVACLALAVAPALAVDRSTDRSADRVQRGTDRTPTNNEVVRDQNDRFLANQLPTGETSNNEVNVYRGTQLFEQASDLHRNGQDNEALRVLTQIAGLQLGSSADADALRGKVHISMARLYDGAPAKQVAHFNSALRYTEDATTQQFIRDSIESLGGVVLTSDSYVSSGASAAARSTNDPGDDTCGTALPAVLPVDVTSISYPGDVNWRYVVVDEDEDFMFIETLITEGTIIPDTSMWLYLGPCPGILINFDEDGGEEFMSFILQSPAFAGTYYVEVRGWCNENVGLEYCANPANETLVGEYGLSITFPDLPTELPPDNYEPDDVREMANKIGHPTSTPAHANSWGRAKRDIQAHVISSGDDKDWMELALQTPQIVEFGTKGTWPTFFNDFTDEPVVVQGRPNPRTGFDHQVHYGVEPCADVTDDMCDPCGGPDCLPCCFVNGNSYQSTVDYYEPQPVSFVPDNFRGLTTPAEYRTCLPNSMHPNTAQSVVEGAPWYAVVQGGGFPTDVFEYEYKAAPVVGCEWEIEPNGFINTPNALTIGEAVWGAYEFSATVPYADSDWYEFDVDELVHLVLETRSPNPAAADTYVELYVGPLGEPFDPFTYLPTGLTDDNGGEIYTSRIEVPGLPPAAELLALFGLPADPATAYQFRVRSRYAIPDFPYELYSEATPMPIPEVEPNDFSEAGANWMGINPGQVVDAEVLATCDMDTYRVSLVEPTFLKVSTATGTLTDTVIEMVDCQNGAVIANICNDDGGAGLASRLDGCLGVGDHCFRVRGFNGSATGTYEFNATAIGTGCPAMDPPSMTSSGPNLGCTSNDCL